MLDRFRDVGPLDTYVNYLGFGLSNPNARGQVRDATWEVVGWRAYVEAEVERQILFWAQLEQVRPLSCVIDGDLFVLVTVEPTVIDAVVRWYSNRGPN